MYIFIAHHKSRHIEKTTMWKRENISSLTISILFDIQLENNFL